MRFLDTGAFTTALALEITERRTTHLVQHYALNIGK